MTTLKSPFVVALFVCASLTGLSGHQARRTATPIAVISGTVVDTGGGVMPGVPVVLHRESGAALTRVTNARGEFEFPKVATGEYRVVASLSGFLTATLKVTVAPDATRVETGRIVLSIGTDEITLARERAEQHAALDANRARWRAKGAGYYRLRVSTNNPLVRTVTESDVRNGSVVVARQRSVGQPRFGPQDWAPSDGYTVERLFQMIDDVLNDRGTEPDGRVAAIGPGPFRDVVSATYDTRRGYPKAIGIGPSSMEVMDGNVLFSVELTVSPRMPLAAPSPGEWYQTPVAARIVDPGLAYDTLFGFGSHEAERAVRRVWPARADEIISRGSDPYWRSVGWTPRPGAVGRIIGTFKVDTGHSVYLLELQHNGLTLFFPIGPEGVALIK